MRRSSSRSYRAQLQAVLLISVVLAFGLAYFGASASIKPSSAVKLIDLEKSAGDPLSAFDLFVRTDDKNDATPDWLAQHPDQAQAVEKGRGLKCLMEKPVDGDAPQSTWTDTAELQKRGWSMTRHRKDDIPFLGLSGAFQDLDISPLPEDWREVNAPHSKDTDVDGVHYPATQAIYTTRINAKDGVLIATYSYSPRHQIEFDHRDIPDDQVVKLERWSDVSYLTRKAALVEMKGDLKNFQHVFKHNIVGPRVIELLKQVTGKELTEIGEVCTNSAQYPVSRYPYLSRYSGPACRIQSRKTKLSLS